MSKPKTARAAKPQKTKAKPKGSEKRTAAQVSDQQREMHYNQLLPRLLRAEAEKADITTEIKNILDEGVAKGIPKKALKYGLELKKDKGIADAKSEREIENCVARWMGLGKQLDLFDGAEIAAQRHFEDGRIAALNDMAAKPPEHLNPNSKDYQTWLDGHAAGRITLNLDRANKFKTQDGTLPPGEAASNVIDTLADRKAA